MRTKCMQRDGEPDFNFEIDSLYFVLVFPRFWRALREFGFTECEPYVIVFDECYSHYFMVIVALNYDELARSELLPSAINCTVFVLVKYSNFTTLNKTA